MNHRRSTSNLILVPALLGIALAAGQGCSAGPEVSPVSLLQERFPEQADRVLAGERSFVSTARGFAIAASDGAEGWGRLDAELPKEGDGLVRLTLADGAEIRVREVGAAGPGQRANGAIAYRRAGGTSFWTALPSGVEEWLHLEPGAVGDDGLAASWEIEGATARQAGDAIEVVDARGLVKIRVTAPAAYAVGGRAIGARLAARGTSIDLLVDETGEEILVDPAWTTASSMTVGRASHASARLADGRVLVSGGFNSGSGYLSSAEIYDPSTNTWTATGSMLAARGRHTLTLLNDGRVLAMGGWVGSSTLTTAELYDPSTGTFSGAGTISPRLDHTATLLGNGNVLVAGGNTGTSVLSDAVIYDPTAGTFSSAASMSRSHQAHTATLLNDGRVLVAGSYASVYADMAVVDIYDPSTDTWTQGPTMAQARYQHAAGKLADGRVIMAGGYGSIPTANSEIYNPSTNAWTSVPAMSVARYQLTGTMLSDGTFLAAGGYSGSSFLASTERYSPATNTWSSAGSMPLAHSGAIAQPIASGYVIVAGGGSSFGSSYLANAELYSPLGGNGGACSAGTDCASGFCVDGVCCSSACAGGTSDCQACSIAAGGPQNGVCGAITSSLNGCAPTCATFQRGTNGTVSDAHITQGSPNGNSGTGTGLSIGYTTSARQGLLQFDLSSIPSTANIISSTLTLRAAAGGGPVLRAHTVTAAWSETTVTWNSFAGAYLSAVEASASLSGSDYTASLTALTQAWVNGSVTNNGVLLERDLTAATTLYSSEWSATSVRPKLYVCYTPHP